jgi:hypothetical protein
MDCGLGFLEFSTFLYRYENSDKLHKRICQDSRWQAGSFSNWTTHLKDSFRCTPHFESTYQIYLNTFKLPQGVVTGSCDRAWGRKARAESIRKMFRFPARDFVPKPDAHGLVAMPCSETT